MEFNNVTTILFSGASICLGAFFGALRSKIFASKNRTTLHYAFYGFSILLFITSIIFLIIYWREFLSPNWFGIIAFIIAILSSGALFYLTKKVLIVKDIYHTSELDPIVNNFTFIADKNEIKLFGGDLNFFGSTPSEMDSNGQYTHLRSLQFNRISIICEEPNDNSKKIRYGKILHDMPQTEIRFYNPIEADLKVRGRMIQVNGVNKLLMYSKIKSKYYPAIETDSADSSGALYLNIWQLVWSLAIKLPGPQIENYKNLFSGR